MVRRFHDADHDDECIRRVVVVRRMDDSEPPPRPEAEQGANNFNSNIRLIKWQLIIIIILTQITHLLAHLLNMCSCTWGVRFSR